jgi:streptomycin 6-kinase
MWTVPVQTTAADIEVVGARLVRRFGPEAERWLAEVPAVAARVASRRGSRSVSRPRSRGGARVAIPEESAPAVVGFYPAGAGSVSPTGVSSGPAQARQQQV